MNKPFFARKLNREDLAGVGGAVSDKTPNWACNRNPNCNRVIFTEKVGNCGQDCDKPGNGPRL